MPKLLGPHSIPTAWPRLFTFRPKVMPFAPRSVTKYIALSCEGDFAARGEQMAAAQRMDPSIGHVRLDREYLSMNRNSTLIVQAPSLDEALDSAREYLDPIRVVVAGAAGRMGREVVKAVAGERS